MADRISALEAEKAALQSRPPTASTSKNPVPARPGDVSSGDAGIAQLRLDLTESLRAKGVTESRLRTADEELGRLRAKTKEDARAVKDLTADRTALTFRVKDREHELKEKRKLLEVPSAPRDHAAPLLCAPLLTLGPQQVQDEHIALNLQLSMVERERDRVKKENKELVDRWMKRMGQEADAMNLANEPHLEKSR